MLTKYNHKQPSIFSNLDWVFEPFEQIKNPIFMSYDKDDHYLVVADVPGVNKESLNIEVKNSNLMISGKRIDRDAHFTKTLRIPTDVNIDNIHASLENGVLNLKIPKAANAIGKKIQIE